MQAEIQYRDRAARPRFPKRYRCLHLRFCTLQGLFDTRTKGNLGEQDTLRL